MQKSSVPNADRHRASTFIVQDRVDVEIIPPQEIHRDGFIEAKPVRQFAGGEVPKSVLDIGFYAVRVELE